MKRILISVGLVVGLTATQAADANAAWSAAGTKVASVGATSVDRPAAPTVVKAGTAAKVTWAATTMGDGTAVTGYTVQRRVGATTTTICTTTAPTVTCNDTSPVLTSADYSVIARYKGWSSQESPRTSFVFDATAPVTTASSTGTPNAAGWIRAASSNVTLTATDTESGVASIRYKVGSGAPVTVNAATTTFAVNAQGSTTITYAATDNAGNVESDKTLTIKLDNVAPTAAMTFPTSSGPFSQGQWQNNCRTGANAQTSGVCGTTVDTASGTDNVQYELRRVWYFLGIFRITSCWNGTGWSTNACGTYRDATNGPAAGSWLIPLPYANLDNGDYELRLQATDVAGNAMPATLVDTWSQA